MEYFFPIFNAIIVKGSRKFCLIGPWLHTFCASYLAKVKTIFYGVQDSRQSLHQLQMPSASSIRNYCFYVSPKSEANSLPLACAGLMAPPWHCHRHENCSQVMEKLCLCNILLRNWRDVRLPPREVSLQSMWSTHGKQQLKHTGKLLYSIGWNPLLKTGREFYCNL